MKKALLLLVLLISWLVPRIGAAQSMDQFQLLGMTNARTLGMGDSGLSVMNGGYGTPVMLNMASLASLKHFSISVDYMYTGKDLSSEPAGGDREHLHDWYDQNVAQGAGLISTPYVNLLVGYQWEGTNWQMEDQGDPLTDERYQGLLIGASRSFLDEIINVGAGVKVWNWASYYHNPSVSFRSGFGASGEFGAIVRPLSWLSIGGVYGTKSTVSDENHGLSVRQELPERWGAGISVGMEDEDTELLEDMFAHLSFDYYSTNYKDLGKDLLPHEMAPDGYRKYALGLEVGGKRHRWGGAARIGGGWQILDITGYSGDATYDGWHLGGGVSLSYWMINMDFTVIGMTYTDYQASSVNLSQLTAAVTVSCLWPSPWLAWDDPPP